MSVNDVFDLLKEGSRDSANRLLEIATLDDPTMYLYASTSTMVDMLADNGLRIAPGVVRIVLTDAVTKNPRFAGRPLAVTLSILSNALIDGVDVDLSVLNANRLTKVQRLYVAAIVQEYNHIMSLDGLEQVEWETPEELMAKWYEEGGDRKVRRIIYGSDDITDDKVVEMVVQLGLLSYIATNPIEREMTIINTLMFTKEPKLVGAITRYYEEYIDRIPINRIMEPDIRDAVERQRETTSRLRSWGKPSQK